MTGRFESGALLGHLYTLRDGTRLRLRLARTSDVPAAQELLAGQGLDPDELKLIRLVHFDPRRRYVVCATGLIESNERLLGLGAIDLKAGAEPDLLVVRDGHSGDLRELMVAALVAAARLIAGSRAA